MLLFERLSIYLHAGMTVDRAFLSAEEGVSRKAAYALRLVRTEIEQGVSLATALSRHVRLSDVISCLIRHGESSGSMANVFSVSFKILEREDELFKKIASAMAYPMIIGLFTVVLTIGLVRGIMPQIIPVLKSLHVDLPLVTRIVMEISEKFLMYGLYGSIAFVLLFFCSVFVYRKYDFVKLCVQMAVLGIPLVGTIYRDYVYSVFLLSCGNLIEVGINIVDAHSQSLNTVPLIRVRSLLMSMSSDLLRGESYSVSISKHASLKLPNHVVPLISAGESTGSLGVTFIKVATIIDRDIEHMLNRCLVCHMRKIFLEGCTDWLLIVRGYMLLHVRLVWNCKCLKGEMQHRLLRICCQGLLKR